MLAGALLAALSVAPLPPGAIAVDAYFNEWAGMPRLLLDRTLQGSLAGPGDLEGTIQVATDGTYLYLAFQVVDDVLQNGTQRVGDGAELRFRGTKGVRFQLVLNDLEGHPAELLKDGRPYKAAKIASTTRRNGWAVELGLPLADLPGVKEGPVGLVATIRDADREPQTFEAVMATGHLRGDGLPEDLDLSFEATAGLYEQYLQDKGGIVTTLSRKKADVTGDGAPEEVVLNDADLVILGQGLADGAAYFFFSHGWPEGTTLGRFDLMELDGRPGKEILLEHTLNTPDVSTTILEVFGVGNGALHKMFGTRLAETFHGRPGVARSTFRVLPGRGKGPARFEVTRASLTDLDEGTYPPEPPGVRADQPMPLPWTSPGPRTYRLEGDAWQPEP